MNFDFEKGAIYGGPDLDCVGRIAPLIPYHVTQMISIGGWDAPHCSALDASNPERINGLKWANIWHEWNVNVVAKKGEDGGWRGFDGIDWDWEGNDDQSSPFNTLPLPCLDLMGEMSVELKRKGYVVSMAPAESYFDASRSDFDVDLRHEYPEYDNRFKYHGLNAYVYVYQRYKYFSQETDNVKPKLTFDWVMVQVYEKWSHALFNVSISKQVAGEYFSRIYHMYTSGEWMVKLDSGNDGDFVSVHPQQLVLGLGTGWATNENGFFYLDPSELKDVYKSSSHQYRGFGVWNVKDDGIGGSVPYTRRLAETLGLHPPFVGSFSRSPVDLGSSSLHLVLQDL